jgi:Protein of unknown function (DUF664)
VTAATDLLSDAFGRIREAVHEAVDGLTPDQLSFRPDPEANSIAWLVWHLTRIQDDHIADVAGKGQVWMAEGWADRLALPLPPADHGYGHTPEQVANVRVKAGELLVAYYDAVHEQTLRYVRDLADADFARVVDDRWDPPVTLGVRLTSVISDDLQHAGQAAYLRGLLLRQ